MASILDRFGIKEVFDLWFYEIDETTGRAGKPVLYIDTAKTSSVEQTAEQTDATGGKGNAVLVSWDHTKEVTVNIEDALFSQKSFSVIYGSGTVPKRDPIPAIEKLALANVNNNGAVEYFTADVFDPTTKEAKRMNVIPAANEALQLPDKITIEEAQITIKTICKEDGTDLETTSLTGLTGEENKKVFIKYTVPGEGTTLQIKADDFPGTYYVVGNTYARSDKTGKDEFFQVIFRKAKMQAENTLELSADGDPAVANLSLKLLRPDDGVMMEVVQYNLTEKAQEPQG